MDNHSFGDLLYSVFVGTPDEDYDKSRKRFFIMMWWILFVTTLTLFVALAQLIFTGHF